MCAYVCFYTCWGSYVYVGVHARVMFRIILNRSSTLNMEAKFLIKPREHRDASSATQQAGSLTHPAFLGI